MNPSRLEMYIKKTEIDLTRSTWAAKKLKCEWGLAADVIHQTCLIYMKLIKQNCINSMKKFQKTWLCT